jgi:hypothetical protein
MTLETANRLRFSYHDNVFVYQRQQISAGAQNINKDKIVPRRSLIIPSIPAMLDTRFPPKRTPSFSLRSPEGRSTTKVGAEGAEGDVKA